MKSLKRIIPLLIFMAVASMAYAAEAPKLVVWTTEVETISPTEGIIKWHADIEEGWHIYGTSMPSSADYIVPTSFKIDEVPGLVIDGDVSPSVPVDNHFDAVMNLNLPWWDEAVTFSQRFHIDGVKGVTISGEIQYMACSTKSCTPPAREPYSVKFGDPDNAVSAEAGKTSGPRDATDVVRAEDLNPWWNPVVMPDVVALVSSSGYPWWMILSIGFLGGLIALLTPCVWPMIPMTISFFLKKDNNKRKSVGNAVIYGVSIVVIYLALGITMSTIFGAGKLNEIATSAVFNIIFFLLLVVFAISFFGAFDIKLPSRWSNSVDNKAETTSGLISIFFMAFTLVLVSFSCTGPIIGTLLVEAATRSAIIGPALGMGGFALGLALPFTLFAFFPSLLKEMPRSGGWLNSVKVVLGFIELILSLKFLSVADLAYGWRILDREVFIAIWIVLFVLLGLYLLGKLRFSHDGETGHISVLRFFLSVASLSFAVYLVPGLWGAPLKGISAFAPPLYTQDFNLYGGTFKEFHDYDEGMQYAKDNGFPVIVDFSGYACVNCRKMEGAVFDTPRVRGIIENDYVLIKLMVDEKAGLDKPLKIEENGKVRNIGTIGDKWSFLQQYKFGISSQPYYVILDNDGKPLMPARVYDEDIDGFVGWLEAGLENYNNR